MHIFLNFIFREREEQEKERERNIDVGKKHLSVAFCTPSPGDLARKPGLYPD